MLAVVLILSLLVHGVMPYYYANYHNCPNADGTQNLYTPHDICKCTADQWVSDFPTCWTIKYFTSQYDTTGDYHSPTNYECAQGYYYKEKEYYVWGLFIGYFTACIPCASGQIRHYDMNDVKTCQACNSNSIANTDQSFCKCKCTYANRVVDYYNTNHYTCEALPPGKVASEITFPHCRSYGYVEEYTLMITCGAGTFCIGGVQSLCPRGSYCPFSGMSAPMTCPAGAYCPSEGMTTYFTCTAGNYCPSGSSAVTVCPVGSYCPQGSSAAVACTAGSYCPNQGQLTPKDCPTGYTCPSAGMSVGCPMSSTTGSAGSITCSPCYYPNYVSGTSCSSTNVVPSTYYIPTCSSGYGLISNTYWAKGYKNCQNPIDNNNKRLWYENWWDTNYASSLQKSYGVINSNWVFISSPTYCDSNVSPLPTMTTQSSWSVNKAGVNNLNPICQQCPRGTYQSNLGTYATEPYIFVCLNCPSGFSSSPGSTSSTQCTSCTYGAFPSPNPNNGAYCYCAAGYYNTVTSTTCTQCTGGYFALSSASVCTICAAGKYSAAGSSACIPCAKGTITNTSGRSVCTPCAGNTYASAEGMSSCTSCSTDQYAVPGSSVCSNCNKKFNCNTGPYMSSCFCSVGEYMSINPLTYCTGGRTVSQDTGFCTTCKTSSSCVSGSSFLTKTCLTGKETSDNTCTACSTGFCPTGYYRNPCNITTNSLCTLPLTVCNNGSYLQGYSVYSNGVCTPCAVCGTGTTISQECSSFAPRICGGVCSNASGCVNSVCAYLSLLGKNSCAICPAGYRVENGLCRACNKNTICSSDGSYLCNGICPLGTTPTCSGCTTCSITTLSVAHAYYDRAVIHSQCTGTFKCDNGYYYDLDSKQCLACFSPGASYIAVTYGLYFNDPSTCIWDLNLVSNVANSMGYYSSLNLLCPTGTTSEANNANYEADCRSCPSIPYVGLIMTNTWLCEWKCDVGYSQVGASCQNNFVTTGCDTKGHILSGLICTLTPIPWQMAGYEAGSNYIYIITSNMTKNLTYYPFQTPSMAAVERTSYLTNSTFTFNKKNITSPGMVCSAVMDVDGTVYVVFCNVSAIFYLDSLNKPRRLIGQSTSGYLEGIKNHALFEAELYIALAEKGRIIVLDTWNCVIREVVLGALGVGDFLTTSYFLFGTIANNQPLCINLIYPKMLFSLAVEGYMAFINKENIICQIQVAERRMTCSSISINMKNFASISSNSNGTILYVMYTNYTLQYSNQGLGACPDDYTSLPGGTCNIYVPWKDGAFGGYYIQDGVAQICTAADCGIGYFPSQCTRSSGSICVACSVQSTYGIEYTMPGTCNYRYISPCPVNTYADESKICQNCPSVMYTSTWNSSGIGSCLCPTGLSKVASTCTVSTSLFPMLDAPLCDMQKYDTTMQSCVPCALADCVSVKVGQYATSCHGNVSSCVIPANSYATSAGTIGIPTSCSWKCEYGYYVDESGGCVQCWNYAFSNYQFYIDDQCNTDNYRWTYTYQNPFICPSNYPFSKGQFGGWTDTYYCSMCYPCLPGYYMTETCNFLIPAVCMPCTVCKHGYKSPCTSTTDAVCHDDGACIANYSLSIPSWLTTHSEIRCKKGEYISNLTDTTPVCTQCPSYLVGLNGMYCEPCIGYKNVYFDNSVCVCRSPTIQNDFDQCVCPIGYYLGISGCDVCGNNTYNDQELVMQDQWWLYNSSCTPCPAGTYSGQGQSSCTACPMYTYRVTEDVCTPCSSGYYAANSSLSTCTSCSTSCAYAQYSEPCPTNESMFLCYDCVTSNPENSHWINVSLLATSYSCLWACNDGYYQDLSTCLQCTYISCLPGKVLAPCTSISDSNCDLDCINVTKPMFNSIWSEGCQWGCAEGYVMRTVNYLTWVQYECVLAGSPSFWSW